MAGVSRYVPLGLGAALIGVAGPAAAQEPARADALERRVIELEKALQAVKAELEESRRQETATAASPQQPPASPAPAAPGDGFRIGNTSFKISGFIKTDMLMSDYSAGDQPAMALGRDFYLPSATPVGERRAEGVDFDAHAKQTRVVLDTATPFASGTLAGHIEADFQTSPGTQGTQRTTNGYNLALRRAFISYGDWTFGQDWSNFMHVAALPEAADFVGPTEGTVFVRQMQVRYNTKLSEEWTLSLAVENPETSSVTPTSAVLVDNDDDPAPDFTAKLYYKPAIGEFWLSGVARILAAEAPTERDEAFGWGLSAAGIIPFGPDGRHNLRFMLTGGHGIGRYIGFNFAPDVVLVPGPNGPDLKPVDVLAGFVALRYGWTDKLRSTVMLSMQDVDNPRRVTPLDANVEAWSVAANLFYSPVAGLDLGIEYRHANREVTNNVKGNLDRLHFVAKQSF